MGYGKHQSFYIRNNWISKGITAIKEHGGGFFFDVNNNYKKIGLGKNMFESLKFWLETTNIVTISNRTHKLTILGEYIANNDIGLQKPITVNLLHYFLVCEDKPNGFDKAESFYWYFNVCNESLSKKEKLLDELLKWDLANHDKATSENTLNKDIDAILSTYTRGTRVHPEDKMTSIFASMKLIKIQDGLIIKNSIDIDRLDYDSLMYMLIRMNEKRKISSLSSLIEEIDSPGRIFNISRTEMIEIIEEMISRDYPIQISRTNNLDTIVLSSDISSNEFLEEKLSRR